MYNHPFYQLCISYSWALKYVNYEEMFLMCRSHSTLSDTECRFRILFHAQVELTWVSDSLVPSWDCSVEHAACRRTTLLVEKRMRQLSPELHYKEMENAAIAGELNSGVGLKELTLEDVGSLWEPNLEDMGTFWANPGEWGGACESRHWDMGPPQWSMSSDRIHFFQFFINFYYNYY